ncbi:DUF4129 domain-containing protein [Streptomyces sp. NPDC088354]|uniref:DUF4129 domain-containing protein n=1 Tax=unclassified Streptomyces TaxID=2593676 RepID=UPI0029B97C4E|nr:DUF4129 domain-containing protein [Streptomyces sp. MI02-7b]MDX3078253.1 DUF4129 domain-containing protein [Streptomyces sp. MI02-7b]
MSGDVPVTIPRVPAREAAEDELSKAVYHQNDPSLLQRALEWLWRKFSDLMDSASGAAPGGTVGLVTVIVLVIVLAVVLRLRLGALRSQPAPGGGLFTKGPRTAAEHRAAAEEHARNGVWTEAVQERMRAIVRSLEERAVIDPRPGRTADEAVADAGRHLPAHAAALRDAARSFDDVTYGNRQGSPEAYTALRDLDTQVGRTKPDFAATPAGASGGARP